MAVQSEVHPMTEFDWKPLRTRVIARNSVVMLRAPAQTSSRSGGHCFVNAPEPCTASTDGPSSNDRPGRQSFVGLRR
jgi:hypothetical protein